MTYWHGPDAETAQEALHNKFTFPGGRRPAQVKLAEPSVPENKLFIGMLSRKAGETEVRELFEPFGEVREIYMIRNADGTSKCAAFLRYAKREPAIQAIETLNQSIQMEGATRPLIVKFADNKVQRQARQMRNTRRDHVYANMRGPPQFPGYPVSPPLEFTLPRYPCELELTVSLTLPADATRLTSSNGRPTSTLSNTRLWVRRWQSPATCSPSPSSTPIHVST